jgi:alkylation response protein AidB-like acyl-CoA dehydrogenase
MDFGLSSDQILLQDTLKRVLAERAPLARVRQYAEQNELRAREVWDALAALGVTGLVIADEHGGSGLGILDAALVAECLGQMVAPTAFIAACVMVPLALRDAGTPAQCARWLPRIAAGELSAGIAISEHTGAREDAAVRHENGKLYGRTLFVIDFAADAFVVADSNGSLYWVDATAAGLTRTSLVTIDRTRQIGELAFDGVTAELLPGSVGGGVLQATLDRGRVLLAADTLGAAQHMLDAAVGYAGQREQFGRLIGSFQAVKHLCAEMAAALEPCRAMMWYAAYALDSQLSDARVSATQTKAHLAEVGKFVAKTATEVHGGVGFTDLLGLHYWFKRIGLNRQLLGGPERLRHEAAVMQGFA